MCVGEPWRIHLQREHWVLGVCADPVPTAQESLELGTLCLLHPLEPGFLHIIKTHPTLKIALEAAAERLGWGGTGLCQGRAV